ncbi:MAG TPA: PAS domain-containing sensor histidine kinase [Anaerolineales bacterium]|nr:PAS domain-containing sensor histidine kinase [Anaerolineales bacterium]
MGRERGFFTWIQAYGLALLALAMLAYLTALGVAPGRPGLFVAALALVPLAWVAAAGCALAAARRFRDTRARWPWNFLGIGLTLWAMAEIIRSGYWVVFGAPPPLPSLVDLLRMAGYFSAVAALGSYPVTPLERFGRLRIVLDVAILSLAVLAFFWMVVLRPAIQIQMAPPIQIFWAGAIPAMDWVLAMLLLRLIALRPPTPIARMFGTFGAAFLILLTSDLAGAYLSLPVDLRPGSLIDAGWLVGALLLAVASRRADPLARPTPASRKKQRWTRLEPLLPVASAYALLGFIALDWRFSGQLDWGGVGVAVALTLLLFGRQGAIIGQNEMRQFAAVVNSSTDLSFICEADGRLRLANPALRKAVAAQLPSEPAFLSDFLASDVPSDRLLRQGLAEGWEGEVSFRRRDGASFPVSLSLIPVHDERRPDSILVGTAHDLTSVKERELDLRAALSQLASAQRELEALNRELEVKVEDRTRELEDTVANLERVNDELQKLDHLKSEFVTLVSHELRAPLTNIRGGVELILAGYPEERHAVKDTLRLVMAETDRLARFIEAILDLSALEAGRFPIRLESLDVDGIARMACARFPEYGEGRLHYQVPADLPHVTADERALTSVLFHLLDNARKYAPLGEITVGARADHEKVYMSVSDTGPGIPPEERERVFEIFHRLDSSDSREVYGHGLGLHLARQLLMVMSGNIWADEAPRGGARLTFWLPRAPEVREARKGRRRPARGEAERAAPR